MGSDSDLSTMEAAVEVLRHFEVPLEVTVVSTHRTPERLVNYGRGAHHRGIKVLRAALAMPAWWHGGPAWKDAALSQGCKHRTLHRVAFPAQASWEQMVLVEVQQNGPGQAAVEFRRDGPQTVSLFQGPGI